MSLLLRNFEVKLNISELFAVNLKFFLSAVADYLKQRHTWKWSKWDFLFFVGWIKSELGRLDCREKVGHWSHNGKKESFVWLCEHSLCISLNVFDPEYVSQKNKNRRNQQEEKPFHGAVCFKSMNLIWVHPKAETSESFLTPLSSRSAAVRRKPESISSCKTICQNLAGGRRSAGKYSE